jgi:hypothetical protein
VRTSHLRLIQRIFTTQTPLAHVLPAHALSQRVCKTLSIADVDSGGVFHAVSTFRGFRH